ncbi:MULTISPECIES: NUDIX hydrolase [Pseudovibrio]|uniref:NUDIX hydrolase n=1 Tax=Stappiaceae TaxID=2821832 RepID=UPI00236672CF|nr:MULTISPECIES: NUDIX hydrolase [Pseudovibrio]MDD7910129.1 NUDIX hydrolase [Pseudovibrio exalbescens]MDX5592412.1 NUDIX hydrolase [Pseudovibrio sp. SPO723]
MSKPIVHSKHPFFEEGVQCAALPFRLGKKGRPEVMLITSRETRRWVIPKGWPMKGKTDAEAAKQEAYEEAGIKGNIGSKKIGKYHYVKLRGDKAPVLCEVSVYPLKVKDEMKRWPEKDERNRKWFSFSDAADLVDEDGLKKLLIEWEAELEHA